MLFFVDKRAVPRSEISTRFSERKPNFAERVEILLRGVEKPLDLYSEGSIIKDKKRSGNKPLKLFCLRKNISKFDFFQIFLAISPFIKNQLSSYLKKIKGPFRPLFCLALILSIFLTGFLVFSLRTTSFSITKNENNSSSQNLFAEPPKNFLNGNQEMVFLQKNTLIGISSPLIITPQVLGIIFDEAEEPRKEIIEYTVQAGDSLLLIAEKFDISLETILWANDLTKNSIIKLGQKLIILPISGIIYPVKKEDTLSEIAKTYKGNIEEIVAFNELSSEGDIYIGDILVIPNGKMPAPSQPSYAQIPLGSSYFICPLSICKITQGLHWYNAIDFDGNCGDPIYAAAGGTVQRVKFGWNGGLGNYLTILHLNGVVTLYSHFSANLVQPSQEVSQGDIIALIGGKTGTPGAGRSTGCHLHFGVQGARNPFVK